MSIGHFLSYCYTGFYTGLFLREGKYYNSVSTPRLGGVWGHALPGKFLILQPLRLLLVASETTSQIGCAFSYQWLLVNIIIHGSFQRGEKRSQGWETPWLPPLNKTLLYTRKVSPVKNFTSGPYFVLRQKFRQLRVTLPEVAHWRKFPRIRYIISCKHVE